MARTEKRVTLKNVADRVGCSVNTVSKVLSGQADVARISQPTVRKVERIASQLGYVPNQMARNLRAKRTGLVGVFITDMTDPAYARIAHAILQQLPQSGFFPVLAVSEAGCDLALQTWLRNRVEGAILCGTPTDMPDTFLAELAQHGIELLIAGNYCCEPRVTPPSAIPLVHVDNHAGIHHAIDHLRRSGSRRIAFITGPRNHSDATERLDAYRSLIAPHQKPIVADVDSDEEYWRRGYAAVEQLAECAIDYDAIIAYDDLVAIGAMKYLNQHGVRIPQDIAVIGFDNLPQAEYVIPSLSSIEQPLEAIGHRSVELLVRNLTQPTTVEHVHLMPTLVVRDSSQAAAS